MVAIYQASCLGWVDVILMSIIIWKSSYQLQVLLTEAQVKLSPADTPRHNCEIKDDELTDKKQP